MSYAIRDKGGRPRKGFVDQFIIQIISELGRATPRHVYNKYLEYVKEQKKVVGYSTIQRCMKRMVDENRIVSVKINDGKQRMLNIYSLAMEKA